MSDLSQNIKFVLDSYFPTLTVEGEVSNIKLAASGHCYFTLKDEDAAISAVLFRGRQTSFIPKDGQLVRVRAELSLYAKRGTYQLICSHIEAQGRGKILAHIEERKQRLAAEGLFSAEHKQALPFFPRRVVVLSSERGAALRDIINVLKRRAPWLNICVVHIAVQGEDAPREIAHRLKIADTLGDVIILSRGGGSVEDLLPFSSEDVVRAIFACSTPLISAIGHEVDYSLSDLVADLRAPTPSAAAEMLCNNAEELSLRILTAGRVIIQAFNALHERLSLAIKPFRREVLAESFRNCLHPHTLRVDDARSELVQAFTTRVAALSQRLALARQELAACSPYSVLERGYAIVSRSDGQIQRGIDGLRPNDELSIQFYNGSAQAQVKALDAYTSTKK